MPCCAPVVQPCGFVTSRLRRRSMSATFSPGSSVRRALLSSLFLISFAAAAFAQGGVNATVRGTVTDSSGGVLPGVSVDLSNVGTGAKRETTTDARGGYLVAGLRLRREQHAGICGERHPVVE